MLVITLCTFKKTLQHNIFFLFKKFAIMASLCFLINFCSLKKCYFVGWKVPIDIFMYGAKY